MGSSTCSSPIETLRNKYKPSEPTSSVLWKTVKILQQLSKCWVKRKATSRQQGSSVAFLLTLVLTTPNLVMRQPLQRFLIWNPGPWFQRTQGKPSSQMLVCVRVNSREGSLKNGCKLTFNPVVPNLELKLEKQRALLKNSTDFNNNPYMPGAKGYNWDIW